jgi:hypothetical protein
MRGHGMALAALVGVVVLVACGTTSNTATRSPAAAGHKNPLATTVTPTPGGNPTPGESGSVPVPANVPTSARKLAEFIGCQDISVRSVGVEGPEQFDGASNGASCYLPGPDGTSYGGIAVLDFATSADQQMWFDRRAWLNYGDGLRYVISGSGWAIVSEAGIESARDYILRKTGGDWFLSPGY